MTGGRNRENRNIHLNIREAGFQEEREVIRYGERAGTFPVRPFLGGIGFCGRIPIDLVGSDVIPRQYTTVETD